MSKYRFIKDSKLERPRNISHEEYVSASYGQEFIYEPIDIPLHIYHFSGSITGSQEYRLLYSLKNIINSYSAHDDLFNYSNFHNVPSALYAFSSVHIGSGIRKGTVELNSYLSGNLISSISDFREDGILYSGSQEKIGLVLYNEGFILINNTASLSTDIADFSSSYNQFSDNPRWIHAFLSASDSLYYDINYDVKSDVATNINFVYAEKNALNHSNNPTYIESGSYSFTSSSYHFKESEEIKVKNTVKSPFNSGSANFEKQTFITRIGLYDEDKKLIGIGSLANPVRKTENREYLFKLRIDF